MPESAVVVLVSPQDYAHFPGCPHKGADPDLSMWGKISEPGAWDRLRDGREMTAVFTGWTESRTWPTGPWRGRPARWRAWTPRNGRIRRRT
jgi:hypothetical protein